MKLSGWGRYPVVETEVRVPRSEADLRQAVLAGSDRIARGNGRAYGDSAISAGLTVHMRDFNRMIAFDPETGQLIAEAGVLLSDIIDAFLPRGWFPAVTPGTKFVTLGGMIAADVHGKNHHRDGSFGSCLDWIDLMGPDGTIRRCSSSDNAETFEWTLGGMGLTGVILRAAIRLRPVETGWIRQTTLPAANLTEAMALFERAQEATYSVAWIDCLGSGDQLGRSLVMLGEHARRDELDAAQRADPFETGTRRGLSVPLDLPSWTLNRHTVRAFNALYYWNNTRKPKEQMVDWDSYFYPLDAILGWNRIYGRKGFIQYQCALPMDSSEAGLRMLLEAIAQAGQGSFLAVLKRFGAQSSRFSFPMEGYTLALDFPLRPGVLDLMDRLDRITLDHGGRFYLAKDSRLSAQTLRASDPRCGDFATMRQAQDLRPRFLSAQADRLSL